VISAGTGQAADLRAQLRRLNLSLPDMPAGFTLHTARYWTNAQAAREDKVSLATYEQRGRLLSYNAEYRRDGLVGLQDVDATVVAYRDERGARWAYERAISNLRQAHEREVSVGQLGSAAVGFTFDKTTHGYSVTADAIPLRRSSYVIIVVGAGLRATFGAAEVASLARLIDTRVQHQR
jgi:hypothetical protein